MPLPRLLFYAFIAILCSPAWSQWAPVPILELGRKADLIVIATCNRIVEPGGRQTKNVTVELQAATTLKGTPSSRTLFAHVAAMSNKAPGPISMPTSSVGVTGIWFLKLTADGFEILPRIRNVYSPGDLFLPLGRSSDPVSSSDTVDRQLLTYVVRWYSSVQNPTWRDDMVFGASFEVGDPTRPTTEDVYAAVAPLVNSSSLAHRVIGLTTALRAGSADALAAVLDDLPTLRSNPKFGEVIMSIAWYPHKDASWIPPLQRLVEMHADVPGLDNAAVAALTKIQSKAILPLLVQLLDSKDPQVPVTVSSYLGVYTTYADSNGDMRDDGRVGPYFTTETRAFTPRKESPTTPRQYADFWKNWWAQNQAKIMAAAAPTN